MFIQTAGIAMRFGLARRLITNRCLSTSLMRNQDDPASRRESPKGATHRPSPMDRKYLVWSGKYKTEADIPEYVQ